MADTQQQQQYPDLRSLVLSGGVKAKSQALFIEPLGWINIKELYGNEKSAVMQASFEQKTNKINIGTMYAELVVRSLRYPHPDAAPQTPTPPDSLQGNPSEEDKADYDKALAKYHQDYVDYQHPYPLDHPHAGELVFQPKDRDAMDQHLPGGIRDAIAEPAFKLSGFKKDEVDDKKAFFAEKAGGIDSTATSLPSNSDDPTLSDSSESLPAAN